MSKRQKYVQMLEEDGEEAAETGYTL